MPECLLSKRPAFNSFCESSIPNFNRASLANVQKTFTEKKTSKADQDTINET